MPDTPSPASDSNTTTSTPAMSAAGIPVSPLKVSVETKLGPGADKEAERLLQDLLGRLDRNQATPTEQAMVSRQVQVIGLTCQELRAACRKNPNHELADHFLKACGTMPDTQEICIEQPDLEALLHNRKMVIRHQVIGDAVVMTKQVVDR